MTLWIQQGSLSEARGRLVSLHPSNLAASRNGADSGEEGSRNLVVSRHKVITPLAGPVGEDSDTLSGGSCRTLEDNDSDEQPIVTP